jgi:APA family basic amino acid/polyamine antiporter
MSAQPQTLRTFQREATGLVREASTLDAFVYNVNFINIGIGAAFIALFYALDYPGADLPLGIVLVTLATIPTALVYSMFAAAMPRSGGDYVYVSRVLGPAWGMVGSWNWTLWNVLYAGTPAAYFGEYGLSQFFRVLGVYLRDPGLVTLGNWFSTPLGAFLAGAALIVVFVGLFIRGLKTYMRVQNVLFALALLSVILTILVLLASNHAVFVANFNRYAQVLTGRPDVYQSIVRAAGSLVKPQTFSLHQTLVGMTWVYLVMGFNIASAYIGGEVKNARRSQLISMPLGGLFAGAFMLVLVVLLLDVIGGGTLRAIAAASPATLGMASSPVYPELVSALTGNGVIAGLIAFGFIFWTYTWLPGNMMIPSRNLLAYSIDHMMPAKLGEVHPRLHAPVFNLALIGALSIASTALFLFGHLPILSGIFGFVLSFFITSVAAVLFPFRMRDVFEASPVNWRIGGVPWISILGGLSIVLTGLIEYFYLDAPDSGVGILVTPDKGAGVVTWDMFFVNVAVLVSGVLIYLIAKAVQRARGIDVDLAFREIPPE